ncbi:trehalose 6-phosphate synthase [Motilibacter rhizosphaerae]|uniref:Trehalose 6-phosphate synthase n=1 Tax=Motilibacter rhizosphaerae TaxID=598652 RepID=A0A4Q7NRD2_9ACTN|nr:trehalose-6-phosphate synthase [Motilibacter rhizosphaerae]RZS89464.1 trehalose 6-phosphate synthase [Motilibacter rhizosphaerae]
MSDQTQTSSEQTAGAPAIDVPVVVLSHRAPVQFRREKGKRLIRRGAGGLVTALVGLAGQLEDAVWVCAATTDEDSAVAAEHEGGAVPLVMTAEPRPADGDEPDDAPVLDVRLVDVPPQEHEDFYQVFSNPLLWFIQHGLYGHATTPVIGRREREAYEQGYVPVNEAFAEAVAEEVRARGGRALVLLHDYHFYLVADRVRQACPEVVLSHFIHIPWPGPDAWVVLPQDIREQIFHGLLGNDVVAFHTERFARNFLLCVQELLGLPIDLQQKTVSYQGRTVAARTYPISIDVGALEEMAASEDVAERREELERDLLPDGEQLLLRVDRTDPSKNIVRGFLAFELLLEQHPELVGRLRFLAFLQPSRLDVPEYADYLGRIGAVVARVNAKYARTGYAPIDLRLQEDFATAVAAYTLCDAVLVNSIADGMNLVAKEMVVVNTRDAVLCLSESTGAHAELGHFAVTLNPFDIQQQADALHEALTMAPDQRRQRLEAAAGVVRANDIGKWLDAQIADLRDLTGLWAGPARGDELQPEEGAVG